MSTNVVRHRDQEVHLAALEREWLSQHRPNVGVVRFLPEGRNYIAGIWGPKLLAVEKAWLNGLQDGTPVEIMAFTYDTKLNSRQGVLFCAARPVSLDKLSPMLFDWEKSPLRVSSDYFHLRTAGLRLMDYLSEESSLIVEGCYRLKIRHRDRGGTWEHETTGTWCNRHTRPLSRQRQRGCDYLDDENTVFLSSNEGENMTTAPLCASSLKLRFPLGIEDGLEKRLPGSFIAHVPVEMSREIAERIRADGFVLDN